MTAPSPQPPGSTEEDPGAPEGSPKALARYLVGVQLAGVAALGLGAWSVASGSWRPAQPGLTLLFAAAMLAAELRPVSRLRKSDDAASVTVSLAYNSALLFMLPGFTSVLVITGVSVLADVINRIRPVKTAFNGAMIALMAAAGDAVLITTGAQSLEGPPAAVLPGIIAACAAMYATNGVLLGTVIALSSGRPIMSTIVEDFWVSWSSDGMLLPLGPVLAATAATRPALLLLLMGLVYSVQRSISTVADEQVAAATDVLTGVSSRRRFDELAEAMLDRADTIGSPVALMLLDLDGFKPINDTHGHAAGDAVLAEVARRIKADVPGEAIIGRLGGDEFVIMLPAANRARAVEVARMVAGVFADPVPTDTDDGRLELVVRGSIGVALRPADGCPLGELTRAADVAMYRAKRSGGAFAFADELGADPLHNDLAAAIDGPNLEVHFQPILTADTRRVVAFEALTRWTHPAHGPIPPEQFIPAAETTALIGPFTRRVLDDALAALADLTARGHGDLVMSVNVSARNLDDPAFVSDVVRAIERHRIDPARVMLELTETALASDSGIAANTLTRLAETGVRIAMDDFGAGHSSVSALASLPVTNLKIDRGLAICAADPRGAAVLRAFVDLGRALGLTVTAEGVDDETLMGHLVSIGFDYVQGHSLATPMRRMEAIAWLAGRTSADRTTADITLP